MEGLHSGVFTPETDGECVETHLFIGVEHFAKLIKCLCYWYIYFGAKYFAFGSLGEGEG